MKIKNIHKIKFFSIILALFFLTITGWCRVGIASAQGTGEYLFHYYSCLNCHTVNGMGGTLGPSLSNYGNENKSYGWTITQIKNPRRHFKSGSEIRINGKTFYALMPAYSYISAGDADRLASYIESLKNK